MDTILEMADLTSIFPTLWADLARYTTTDLTERTSDNIFNFRDPGSGFNADFMTYAMYVQANKSAEALLDPDTHDRLAKKTFQTFFQHFTSSQINESRVYQPLNALLPDDLGPVADLKDTGTTDDPGRSEIVALSASQYSHRFQMNSTTNSSTIATVSTPVEVLEMNPAAVWLSISILVCLICIMIVVLAVQHVHFAGLIRNVDTLADALILIAGSDNLLRLVRERGPEALSRSTDVLTQLAWFSDSRGEVRWGVEIVDSQGNVID